MCSALVFNLSIIFMLPIFHAVKFNTYILALYIMHQSDWPNRLLYAVAVLPIFWHYSSFTVLSLSWTLDAARNDHTQKMLRNATKTVVGFSTGHFYVKSKSNFIKRNEIELNNYSWDQNHEIIFSRNKGVSQKNQNKNFVKKRITKHFGDLDPMTLAYSFCSA